MDAQAPSEEPLLRISNLSVHFRTSAGVVRAVDGVDYEVLRGETLAVVGESGCGKSVTALAVLGLLPRPPAEIPGGSIVFAGEELVGAPQERLREIRGDRISMIFQEPMTSLNPVFTIGDQIMEGLVVHRGLGGEAARREAARLLELVRIPAPEQRLDEYPHQLSGGMRQRVMIAMALACRPEILIADEPTTALDVTVQAQIFDLLRELQREKGTAILLITHDMGAVAEMADRAMVMYAGRVIEQGTADEVLAHPGHPYTQGLIDCLPELGSSLAADAGQGPPPLAEIAGVVPSLWELASGCTFRERCPRAMSRCAMEVPPMLAVAGSDGSAHLAACWLLADPSGATPALREAVA
jgi:peptide/nickel transport system ATP-binding protein